MRQDEVVIALEQHELMLQAVLALAQRIDAPAHGRHALAKGPVQPLDKSGVDLSPPRPPPKALAQPAARYRTRPDISPPRGVDAGTTSPPAHRATVAAASSAVSASGLCPGDARVASRSRNAPAMLCRNLSGRQSKTGAHSLALRPERPDGPRAGPSPRSACRHRCPIAIYSQDPSRSIPSK